MAQPKSTARKSTARKPAASRAAAKPAAPKRRAYSILTEAEVDTLEGVKLSALPKAKSYRVYVTHDKAGNPNGFECEPIDEEA